MKRYLLFVGEYYYPAGGWDDFSASFDTIDEAKAAAPNNSVDWWHVIDTKTEQQVASG